MQKINFVNNQAPALNADNLNQLQTNVENAINGDDQTWTPTINTLEEVAPTITYTTQSGRYIRVGNLIYIRFYIRGKITALNGTNNYAVIEGLPVSIGGTFGTKVIPIGILYGLLVDDTNANFLISGNKIRIQMNYGAGAGTLKVTPANYFEIAGCGIVDA